MGLSNLVPAQGADPLSLIDTAGDKRAAAERAMDKIRAKFGGEAVGKGRAFEISRRSLRYALRQGVAKNTEVPMSIIEARLQKVGITLPNPPKPVASYVPYTISGNQVIISGQVPIADGALK